MQVIGVTDGQSSPIATRSGITLLAKTSSKNYSFVSAMTIADALSVAVGKKNKEQLNAYNALLDAVRPCLMGVSGATQCVIILWFNVVEHILGAAVAQMTFTAKIFGPFLAAAGVGPAATAAVILGSAQIDWFGPFPTSDMFGQMGLAWSSQIKYALYNGWAVVVGNFAVFSVLFYFLT